MAGDTMVWNNGDVGEVVARCTFGSAGDVINVYQFQMTSAGPIDDDQAASDLTGIIDGIYSSIESVVSSQITATDIDIRNLTTGEIYGAVNWPFFTGGTALGDALPPGVAAVINFVTGVARVVLRKYYGGLTEGNNDSDGTWSTGLLAALVSVAMDLILEHVGTNATWRYGHFSPKTLSFLPATGYSITDIPGYQRRRKQGRGS